MITSADMNQGILTQFKSGKVIPPPKRLSPIYVDPKQSDDTRFRLAVSYSCIPLQQREGLQLFSVPPIEDGPNEYVRRAYCKDLYKNFGTMDHMWKPDNTWTKLDNTKDLNAHEGMEMVIKFPYYIARQWGDNTFLIKPSYTRYGATEVFRFINPHHPNIVRQFGTVNAAYVRPYAHGLVPKPFYRFPSVPKGSKIGNSDQGARPQVYDDYETHLKLMQQELSGETDIRKPAPIKPKKPCCKIS